MRTQTIRPDVVYFVDDEIFDEKCGIVFVASASAAADVRLKMRLRLRIDEGE